MNGHIGPQPGSTIAQDFASFNRENPQVYDTLVALARRWKGRHPGRRVGIKMLYEVARWTVAMDVSSDEPVKLNNNYTSHYARLIMQREHDLSDIFETRQLHAPDPFSGRLFADLEAA